MLNEQLEREIANIHHPSYYTTKQAIYLLQKKGPYCYEFNSNGNMELGSLYIRLYYYEKSFIMYFSDPSLLYMSFYIVCSVIGFFSSPIIYCFHLLDVMNRFPMLKSVI